jgi:hypothetical protein
MRSYVYLDIDPGSPYNLLYNHFHKARAIDMPVLSYSTCFRMPPCDGRPLPLNQAVMLEEARNGSKGTV